MNLPGAGRGRRRGGAAQAPSRNPGREAIEAAIRVLLQRDPEPGRDAVILALGGAGLVGDAIAQLVAGDEYRTRQAVQPAARRPAAVDETLVVGAYRVLLRRDPGEAERQSWVSRLQTGGGLEEMVAGVLGTEEFMVRYEELRRRARLDGDDRERLALARRLGVLEDRIEALIRAEELRRQDRDSRALGDRPGR